MFRSVLLVFLILHAGVHLLYFGQSRRLFELQPGLIWPEGSWALSKIASADSIRLLGSAAMIVAAAIFVIAGAALLLGQSWWVQIVVGAAAFSSVAYIVLWDGRARRLDQQGAIGVLIDLAVLALALVWGERILGTGGAASLSR